MDADYANSKLLNKILVSIGVHPHLITFILSEGNIIFYFLLHFIIVVSIYWARHVPRTMDNRWIKTVIDWYPRDMERNGGRSRQKW